MLDLASGATLFARKSRLSYFAQLIKTFSMPADVKISFHNPQHRHGRVSASISSLRHGDRCKSRYNDNCNAPRLPRQSRPAHVCPVPAGTRALPNVRHVTRHVACGPAGWTRGVPTCSLHILWLMASIIFNGWI